MWKRTLTVLLAIAFAIGTAGLAGAAGDDDRGVPIQLIADQATVTAGGKATFHLIYHNVENKARTNTQIHVKVHEWMDVVDAGGGEWDASNRLLKWNVKDVESNGAHVVHFQLKIKADAKRGDVGELEAEIELDGGVKWKTPKVKVEVGTETHQPFMQGYPDGMFRPDGALTRAETAAMIARIKGLKSLDAEGYSDVPASHWAYRYIRQASAEGYMVGFDGKFRPDEPITKAELLTLMLRLHGVHETPFDTPYEDMKGHWSKHALGTALALGYVKHLNDEKDVRFAPDSPIERKAAAAWLSVGLLRGPLKDGETKVVRHFPDVPADHPYFEWIEEASAVAHESERRGDGAERLVRYLPEATSPF
ncbi:S-layer homology domain-containing protein [Paenibacillus sp.]|uniref:S-layer homology domain-containing protein n=1 Tax=Paenibacillus sp. TaxID=58172 RepID=UPI002811F3A4|nr:S-layer homology domain-containing protein [Paenibacillus sp.]